jgi:hypothetical protein
MPVKGLQGYVPTTRRSLSHRVPAQVALISSPVSAVRAARPAVLCVGQNPARGEEVGEDPRRHAHQAGIFRSMAARRRSPQRPLQRNGQSSPER